MVNVRHLSPLIYMTKADTEQRILRDDPAKGLTALEEPLRWPDFKRAWTDPSMWGLYFIGLVAYIPATPVQGYLSITLKTLGFSTFDSNMLSAVSAAIQVITMLCLAKSSEWTGERTFHAFFGELWVLPLLAALLGLPAHGHLWTRFTLTTLISGCAYHLLRLGSQPLTPHQTPTSTP